MAGLGTARWPCRDTMTSSIEPYVFASSGVIQQSRGRFSTLRFGLVRMAYDDSVTALPQTPVIRNNIILRIQTMIWEVNLWLVEIT